MTPQTKQEPTGPNVRVIVEDLIGLRRRVEGLQLKRGQPSRSVITGGHRSRFRGRGMDYQESRHYQAGDDIRNMDWRITARAGRPHVKLYEEERERPVVTLLDLGPSMFFGYARRLQIGHRRPHRRARGLGRRRESRPDRGAAVQR